MEGRERQREGEKGEKERRMGQAKPYVLFLYCIACVWVCVFCALLSPSSFSFFFFFFYGGDSDDDSNGGLP